MTVCNLQLWFYTDLCVVIKNCLEMVVRVKPSFV